MNIEYHVVWLTESVDAEDITRFVNEKAKRGWKLHSLNFGSRHIGTVGTDGWMCVFEKGRSD